MKSKVSFVALVVVSLALAALPARAAQAPQISGQYIESRTADVYTGPCFANSEVNLTGQDAVLAWHVDRGSWQGVPLDGLRVVAVVRAHSTLGDPYTNPLPAKTVMIVDERANAAQRAALANFAQAQAGGLLNDVIATEVSPIQFAVDAGRHGYATLEAGHLAQVSTRAITSNDEICHNEEIFYPPLAANLGHSMPAVATHAGYSGNHLGATWSDSERRSAFVGTFSF